MVGVSQLLIGTYPSRGRGREHSREGIWLVNLDGATGQLSRAVRLAEAYSPTFMARHPFHPILYAVSEVPEDGRVLVFKIGEEGEQVGSLSLVGTYPTGGAYPCMVTIVGSESAGQRALVVTNYSNGVVACYPLSSDGRIADGPQLFPHEGHGKVAGHQDGPHAHSAAQLPGGWVVVADKGTDQLRRFRIQGSSLVADGVAAVFRPGTGPRHLVVSPDRCHLYVAAELSGDVSVVQWDESGTGREVWHVAASDLGRPLASEPNGPCDRRVVNHPSHIQLSSDRTRLYVANRGPGTIATFEIEAAGDGLRRIAETDAGCDGPWHFAVVPGSDGGEWVVVAGCTANRLTVLYRGPASEAPEPTGIRLELPQPSHVMHVRTLPAGSR